MPDGPIVPAVDVVDPAVETDAFSQTLGKSSDLLPLLLTRLSLPEQLRAGEVSVAWREASSGFFAEHIRQLDLRPHAPLLTNGSLEKLVSKCPRLQSLNLSGCKAIGDDGLKSLPMACPQLNELNLACIPQVTADGVGRVVDALGDKLASVELGGCSGISASQLVARFSRFLELDDDEDGLAKVQG